MKRAIILDYSDNSIVILPIPDEIYEKGQEDDYVQSHPAYDSQECDYMISGEETDVYEVIGEEDGKATYEFNGRI